MLFGFACNAQGLVLAKHSGITPGRYRGTIWNNGLNSGQIRARQVSYPLCSLQPRIVDVHVEQLFERKGI